MEKINLTQQNHTFAIQHNINTQKLKPGLVASYDIWPGNGESLLWFRRFINLLGLGLLNLSDTYPLTNSPVARDPHRAVVINVHP